MINKIIIRMEIIHNSLSIYHEFEKNFAKEILENCFKTTWSQFRFFKVIQNQSLTWRLRPTGKANSCLIHCLTSRIFSRKMLSFLFFVMKIKQKREWNFFSCKLNLQFFWETESECFSVHRVFDLKNDFLLLSLKTERISWIERS